MSSLFYSSLLLAEFGGFVPHINLNLINSASLHEDPSHLYVVLLSNNALFFIAAVVSGLLHEKLVDSRNELERSNEEILEMQETLRGHMVDLEKRVAARTSELTLTNEKLCKEIEDRRLAEEGLRNSQERLSILFEYAPDPYFLMDLEGKFIDTNRDRPFFLYLSHHAVHTPIQAKKELIEKYKKKKPDNEHNNPTYAAMIESVDQSVATVMDKLDELGLTDNTVVFFFSDNGGYANATSMAPLRGSKGMLYEGGIRVPMAVRWPPKARPGRLCDVPVIGIDFYPTMLEMAGVPKTQRHILDGQSIVALLTAKKSKFKKRPIFWHFPAYLESYNEKQWPWRTTPASAVRLGDWKLIEFFEPAGGGSGTIPALPGKFELYNIKDDIGEKNDLAGTMPDKVEELHRILVQWRKSVGAPVPTERNPQYDPKARAAGMKKARQRKKKKG